MDIRPSSSTRGGWKQFIQHVDYLTSIRFGWYQGSPLRNYNDVVAGAFLKLATSPDPPNIDGVWCQKDRKVDLKHLDRDWFFYLVRLFRDTCILLYTIVYYCILLYTCNMLVYHKDQRGGRKQQQASVLKHPHPFRPAALSVGWNTKCLGPEPGATAMWPRNRLNLWEWRWQHPKQPAVPGENPSPELLLWILTWLVGGFNPSEKY